MDFSAERDAQAAFQDGIIWLVKNQNTNGSWSIDGRKGDTVAVTSLILSALVKAGPNEYTRNTTISNGLHYVLSKKKADGSIYQNVYCKNYSTAIALRMLKDCKSDSLQDIIQNAENYLLSSQFDEGHGYKPDSPQYGGVGYGGIEHDDRPDLSNLQWALSGLSDQNKTEIEKPKSNQEKKNIKAKAEFYRKVKIYLDKCQNLKSVNPRYAMNNDGGFIYKWDESKAGENKSYGSMTYAGFLSLIYIGTDINNTQVKSAFEWIQSNYTVDENPGLGIDGLYYYYNIMAKALHAYGNEEIIDAKKIRHQWAQELSVKLVGLQRKDGSWNKEISTKDRWLEDNPALVTGYIVNALEEILPKK